MELKPEHKPTDTVFIKTDVEQLPRVVTAYKVTISEIIYELACGTCVSWHYAFEISSEHSTKHKITGLAK